MCVWTFAFAVAGQASRWIEHFKYGSVGIESEEGIPYWIWQVLPRMFADKLPGGYASLGFIWEPGRELPIGFSKKNVARLGADRGQLRVLPYRDLSHRAWCAARDRARRRDNA